tara:strand:+ start:881 stop:1753 length:873 start_codon:yes stop_codon:yes gene_type:complete
MNKKWIWINAILLAAIIYLKYLNAFTGSYIASHNLLGATSTFFVFYMTIVLLSNIVKLIYSKKYKIPKNQTNNVYFGVDNIARFTATVGFFLYLLSVFGINPKDFITSLTIVAAAIAILTKEFIVDYMSGLYLSFSNTFEISDYVKIGDQKGKIVEINMLKVKLLNDDDDLVIIPNSKVHYNEIINYTKRDVRLMNIDFQIALKYINNIEQLEREIIASLRSFEQYIEPKSYNLKVVEMKMDHLDCKFQYTLILADMDMQRKIRKKTIREVFNFISSMKEHTEKQEPKNN